MSEVSAATIRRAHAVHPLAAVQTEYSLWTRNAEVAVLDTCRELGITFVAFSPLARGFLTGELRDVSALPPKDIRLEHAALPGGHWEKNLSCSTAVAAVAREQGCTMGQLALAWLLARAPHIVPIPGTTRTDHMRENLGALDVRLYAGHHRAARRADQHANRVGTALQRGHAAGNRHRGRVRSTACQSGDRRFDVSIEAAMNAGPSGRTRRCASW